MMYINRMYDGSKAIVETYDVLTAELAHLEEDYENDCVSRETFEVKSADLQDQINDAISDIEEFCEE